MKIIKEGVIPVEARSWPLDTIFVCNYCSCEFNIESKDDFITTAERHIGGEFIAYFICPTCERQVVVNRPAFGVL